MGPGRERALPVLSTLDERRGAGEQVAHFGLAGVRVRGGDRRRRGASFSMASWGACIGRSNHSRR